jgi:hypothetical protein
MNNLDHISESLRNNLLGYILKFFDADQGWKKFGCGINIPDPKHCFIRIDTTHTVLGKYGMSPGNSVLGDLLGRLGREL